MRRYSLRDDQWERIREIADAEEQSFSHTLTSGTALFDMAAQQVRSSGGHVLAGDKAFQLHDTYGFPVELTLEMAAEAGWAVVSRCGLPSRPLLSADTSRSASIIPYLTTRRAALRGLAFHCWRPDARSC